MKIKDTTFFKITYALFYKPLPCYGKNWNSLSFVKISKTKTFPLYKEGYKLYCVLLGPAHYESIYWKVKAAYIIVAKKHILSAFSKIPVKNEWSKGKHIFH